MNDTAPIAPQDTSSTAKIIYVLYLASLILGITGLIGVIMAYVTKGQNEEWLEQHYRYQIRTFWIGFLMLIVGGILSIVLVGVLVLFFYLVWIIVRCVKGLQALDKKQAPHDPATWMW